jgi:hypothetical protein
MNLQTGKLSTPQEAFNVLKGMPGFSGLAKAQTAAAREAPQRDATVALASDVVDKGVEPVAPRIAAAPPPAGAARTSANAPAPSAPPAGVAPAVKPEEGEQPAIRISPEGQAAIAQADAWARSQPEVKSHIDEAKEQRALAQQAQVRMSGMVSKQQKDILAKQFENANRQATEATSRAEAAVTRLTGPIHTDISRQLGVSPQAVEGAARMERGKALALLDPSITERQLEVDAAKSRSTKNIERDFAARVSPSGGEFLLPPGQNVPPPVTPRVTAEQAAAPRQAAVDPITGALQLARPAAPANGGSLGPPAGYENFPQIKLTKDQERQHEEDAMITKDVLEKMQPVAQARQRYVGLVNAFKLFESGSTEATRAGWAAVAQTFGQPDIARAIASGEPAGVEWVQKIGPNLVLDTLKAAQPRFAQSEFNTLATKGTPEPNKLPQTNFQMVKEGLATLNRTEAFMHAWDRASREEGWSSPKAYYIAWSNANPLSAFEKSVERQMGNFAGMSLPPAKNWAAGATYVIPSNLPQEQAAGFLKQGLKAGDVFRYEGPGEGSRITPIKKQELYSMGMVE